MGNITAGLTQMMITPLKNGAFKVETPDWQLQIFRQLSQELKIVLSERNSYLTTRLFPVAYKGDKTANAEYEQLTHEELLQSHLASLKLIEEITNNAELSETTLIEIMQGINILRLVLGTRLKIDDENSESSSEISESHPDHNLWLVFHLLGQTLSTIVDSINH